MHTIRRLSILASTAVLAVLAAPAVASAAGPGRLAIAPLHGRGLITASPAGGQQHRICTDATLCGRPSAPRFSPNGQAIAFVDARHHQAIVIGQDGTCLWCLGTSSLPHHQTSEVAFDGNDSLTLAGAAQAGVRVTSLTGDKPAVAVPGTVTAADTSSRGVLATSIHGVILVRHGLHSQSHRVTRGNGPVWSPAGRTLAFTRAGAVWTIRPGADRPRRLAPGSSPAWSPRGARIAFVAPGGQIRTMSPRGTHRHDAGTLHGRSVAWGPSPGTTCGAKGTVVQQTATAVLRAQQEQLREPQLTTFTIWAACLRLTGQTKTFNHAGFAPGPSTDTLVTAAVAGRYVAAEDRFAQGSQQPGCDLKLFDLGAARILGTVMVPFDQPCSPTFEFDDVALDSSGLMAWHLPGTSGESDCAMQVQCVGETLTTNTNLGDHGVIDQIDPGSPGHIANVSMPLNGTTVRWTRDGRPRSLQLR